jgi:hypothetical protein
VDAFCEKGEEDLMEVKLAAVATKRGDGGGGG